jgi:hypothetical protein
MQMYMWQWECCLSIFEGVLALGPKVFRIPPKPFWEFQWKLIQRTRRSQFVDLCAYICMEFCVYISLISWIFLPHRIVQAPSSIINVCISSCNSSAVPILLYDMKVVIPNSLYIKGECCQLMRRLKIPELLCFSYPIYSYIFEKKVLYFWGMSYIFGTKIHLTPCTIQNQWLKFDHRK